MSFYRENSEESRAYVAASIAEWGSAPGTGDGMSAAGQGASTPGDAPQANLAYGTAASGSAPRVPVGAAAAPSAAYAAGFQRATSSGSTRSSDSAGHAATGSRRRIFLTSSIRSLIHRQNAEDFTQEPVNTFLCPICFGNLPEPDGYHLRACPDATHVVCKQCMRGYVSAYMSGGGAIREMTCPIGDECQAPFSPLDVSAIDPEGAEGPLFQRYSRFAKQQSGKHAACPKCGFLNEGNPETSPKMLCSNCSTKYCFHHGSQHDPDKETCDQYLRRSVRAEQASNSVLSRTTCECPGCGLHVNKRSDDWWSGKEPVPDRRSDRGRRSDA